MSCTHKDGCAACKPLCVICENSHLRIYIHELSEGLPHARAVLAALPLGAPPLGALGRVADALVPLVDHGLPARHVPLAQDGVGLVVLQQQEADVACGDVHEDARHPAGQSSLMICAA